MEISRYWLTRWLFQCSLALVYLTAFLAVLYQFTPLLGCVSARPKNSRNHYR